MSAAIFDIRLAFPGYSSEMYIMSESGISYCLQQPATDMVVTSGFVLGFVVGPLIWAPCSEVFGRRTMFYTTFAMFTIFLAACCGAKSLEALIVLRFLAGTFGASCLTSTGCVSPLSIAMPSGLIKNSGIIADMFNAAQRGSAMGLFALAPFLGPAIGPVVSDKTSVTRCDTWGADTITRPVAFWPKPHHGNGSGPCSPSLPSSSPFPVPSSFPRLMSRFY